MTPKEIKSAIKAKGLTQKSIAIKIGKSEIAVSMTVNKNMVSDYIMRGIAGAIGNDPVDVFPEYYLSPAKRSTSKTVQPFRPAV